MQTKIEKIGDSFGLLLPKELLEARGFGGEATVTIQENALLVTPFPHRSRQGWAEVLARIPQTVLDQDFEELQGFSNFPEVWDEGEWQWPDGSTNEKV